jgi:hypothetical protein
MSYRVPLSNKGGIVVDWYGSTRFSAVRWNNIMRCWVCDFKNGTAEINSLALRAGTDLLKQFGLPYSLYIVNNGSPGLDPGQFSSLTAYITEPGDLG